MEVDAVGDEKMFVDVNVCDGESPANIVVALGSVSVTVPFTPVGGVISVVPPPLVALPRVIVPSVPLAPSVIVEEYAGVVSVPALVSTRPLATAAKTVGMLVPPPTINPPAPSGPVDPHPELVVK